ncbi:MAG: hypothetical protein WAU33_16435 [Candidatus Binataceae bacterium]
MVLLLYDIDRSTHERNIERLECSGDDSVTGTKTRGVKARAEKTDEKKDIS